MTNKIQYHYWEKIGKYNHRFIQEIEPRIKYGKNGKMRYIRYAIFKCGICGQYFTASIEDIKSSRTKSCGCLKKGTNFYRVIIGHTKVYKNGDRLGPYKILLEKRLQNYRGIFKCPECGKDFESSLSCVASGHTRSCGCIGHDKPDNISTDDVFGKLHPIYKTKHRAPDGQLYWMCRCECGNLKEVTATNLRNGCVKSCGQCMTSAGNQRLYTILKNNNISYKPEYCFQDCKDIYVLPFDVYLPNQNIAIEYDGIQHFKYNRTGWATEEKYIRTKKHDDMKDNYCLTHGIKLIRIPYTDYENLDINYLLKRGVKLER